eukprot:m.48147 g.48147  ORF g.48147 m.48147 type:complete len:66 (+) comp17754_c0_seq1:894-1091(+)
MGVTFHPGDIFGLRLSAQDSSSSNAASSHLKAVTGCVSPTLSLVDALNIALHLMDAHLHMVQPDL